MYASLRYFCLYTSLFILYLLFSLFFLSLSIHLSFCFQLRLSPLFRTHTVLQRILSADSQSGSDRKLYRETTSTQLDLYFYLIIHPEARFAFIIFAQSPSGYVFNEQAIKKIKGKISE